MQYFIFRGTLNKRAKTGQTDRTSRTGRFQEIVTALLIDGIYYMKILMVITELGPGGAERVVANLARVLASRGHAVTVLSIKKPPSNDRIPRLLSEYGIRFDYLNSSKRDPAILFKLRRAFKKQKPDIIHSHLMHPNILSRIAARGLDIPVINTIHIAERRTKKKLLFMLDSLTWSMASKVTAVSRAAAEFHASKCGVDPASIEVIYNGVEPVPQSDPLLLCELKEMWNLGEYDRIIGSIGRLDRQKGYDLLLSRLDVLSKMISPGRKWLFLIIGEGPEMNNLKAQAASLRYDNISFLFPGFRTDAAPLMSLFDVFVMPSRYEGYGLALAEAMTLGLPVVCSNADSLPELCALYTGDSFIVDMEKDVDGDDLALKLLSASECNLSVPCVIMDDERMTEHYLEVYNEVLASE